MKASTKIIATVICDDEGNLDGKPQHMTWGEWKTDANWGRYLTPEAVAEVEAALSSVGHYASFDSNADGAWRITLS